MPSPPVRYSSVIVTAKAEGIAATVAVHFRLRQNFDPNGQFRYIHFPQGFSENHHLPKNPLAQLAVNPELVIRIAEPEPTISTILIGLESCYSC